MKFFSRILGRKASSEVIDTPEKLAAYLGVSAETFSGRSVTPQTAMQLVTVFGCVRVLAESVGMLPCKLMTREGGMRKPADDHSLSELLSIAPNDYMTAQEFWELAIACLCLRGNFYAYKVKVMGQVKELLPIDPGAVNPKLNDDWSVAYEITFRDGTKDVLTQDEIWHVRIMTLDGLNGVNPVAYARQAIGLGLATEEHGSRLFKNGTVTSGVLTTKDELSNPAFERLKKQFNEDHGGLTNAHKPLILEMGLEWKPTALNLEDSQFLETRKFQRDEICGLYRVPPHLVANLERATFSNIEHQSLSFVNYSLVPYLTRIESRIRVGLLSKQDRAKYYAKFNAAALLRGDLKSRYESYGQGINWGILSPNDCRETEDLNPRPGGDVYLTPMNMTTKPEAANADDKTS
ncbi:phage portal protein [Pontibacter sp. JAM-7]|uniref:phage portal protein n=1 Tax=Pontibacter sp. JAM-7 TaxID=3366581 RepID=UPI003AF6E2D8